MAHGEGDESAVERGQEDDTRQHHAADDAERPPGAQWVGVEVGDEHRAQRPGTAAGSRQPAHVHALAGGHTGWGGGGDISPLTWP